MSKVVMLNSGGFDSIVLANHLKEKLEIGSEVRALHFRYGARNEKQQLECYIRCCDKLGFTKKVIDLPKFDWTKGNFYGNSHNKSVEQCYLEWRNLIFLSYAISYAESIGAGKIYLATFEGAFSDTSKTMFDGLNTFLKESGIEILTPFSRYSRKEDMLLFAIKYRIQKGDYFSCDVPVNGKPCGECLDCNSLWFIDEKLNIDNDYKAYLYSDKKTDTELYKRVVREAKVREVQAIINNKCQLQCNHCFYGFEKLKAPILSKEIYMDLLEESVWDLGVENICFSGKEPLFDDTILYYAKEIVDRKLPCTFSVVTNGINVPKYAEELKKYGVKSIMLSVDPGVLRNTMPVVKDALLVCDKLGIDVVLLYDLYRNYGDCNAGKVFQTLYPLILKRSSIGKACIRTVHNIGNAECHKNKLTVKDLEAAFMQISALSDLIPDVSFSLDIGIEYTNSLQGSLFERLVNICDLQMDEWVKPNLTFNLERYCSRYIGKVVITPDGYVLGCDSELASKNYDQIAAGNLCTSSIKECRSKGRSIACNCNGMDLGLHNKRCSFLYETT